MSDNYNLLISRLDAFVRKFYKNQLLRGAIYAFTLSLGFYLLVILLESFGHFNTGVRTVLFYSFIAGFAVIIARFVAVPLMHLYRFGKIISHEQAADIIGRHFTNVQDKLLNVLQLKRQADENNNINPGLLVAGIDQKIEELKPVPFITAINLNENRRYLRFAFIPLVALIIMLFAAPSIVKDSTKRLIDHQTYFEKPAPFAFEVLNKSLKTVQQQDFQLDIRINGNEIPADAYIEIDGNQFRLEKENLTTFHYLFKNLQRSQDFRLTADGFYSAQYTLEALPNPLLMNFAVALEYPSYLRKQNETIRNTGELVIPEGTKVKWDFMTKNTDAVNLVFHDTIISLEPSAENEFTYSHRFLKSDNYTVTTRNHFLNSKDSIHYSISVIPDIYPSISVEQQRDSFSGKRTFFKGLLKDDYGFTKLSFNYRFLKSNDSAQSNTGKIFSEQLPVNKSLSTDEFFYTWDLATVNIAAGDEVEYYFEVFDNDGIAGPKSARSQTQVFKAPSLKEIADNTEKNNQSIKDDLKESVAQAKQMQKDLSDLSKKVLDKKELSYDEKKKAADLLDKQKELEKKLEDIKNKNDQKNQQAEEYKKVNEDIQQKQQQLQSILDKLKSPELQKLLEQLQQLMQNVDKNQMQEQLSQMKLDNKDLQKELERSIELFKQMEFEQKLQDNIDKLNDLAKKEDDLSKKSDKNEDEKNGKDKDAEGKDLKDQQDKLNKDFEDFKKDMDDLAKKNDELEEKKEMENTDQQQQDIKNDMEKSSEQLSQSKSGKASKSQKSASGKMSEMAQKMSKMQQQMQQEQAEEDMNALRALLENLLRLSFNQEQLMQDLKSTDINNPQYLKLSQQQQKLKDDAKMIEDSLFALSKRVMEIQSKVNQEISSINDNMDESLDNLEGRLVPQARSRQQFVMTSVNNLTLLLSEVLQQMQQQSANSQANSSCNKPGKKKSSSLAELSKMQSELNKNMQKMKEKMQKEGEGKKPQQGKKSGGSGSMSEDLAKMAAQQEFIRNELNKINQTENKDGKNSLGNLQDIANKMEDNEKDIVNKMITEETMKRQQEITSRLLESEKAEQERDQDEQRKSEEAKSSIHRNPSEFEEYKRLKLKEMELLKTVPPSLNTYYRQKVNEYFQSIDK